MKRNTLFLLACVSSALFFSKSTFANPITKQQAHEAVKAFINKKGKNLRIKPAIIRSVSEISEDEKECLYFFNIENNNGFIIASGDDSTPAILGYTDKGSYDEDSIPENMKSWLVEYKRQVAYNMKRHAASAKISSSYHPKITPLLSTIWHQHDPYNLKCPTLSIQNKRCVTGCVATAMAQVMFYHRNQSVNKTTKEIPGYLYTDNNEGDITVEAFPQGSIIDWDNILDSYDGSETQVQKEAVAYLLAYCGASVQMEYGTETSYAYSENVLPALQDYFNYSESMFLENRIFYTDKEWDDLIYSELAKGNPIYYSGSPQSGKSGHAFVCDGYDGNGYYHINWGWGGSYDGYFLLSALNPYLQGVGYNMDHQALIGAKPKAPNLSGDETYAVFKDSVLTFYHDKYRNSRNGTTYDLNKRRDYPNWVYESTGVGQGSLAKARNIKKVVFDESFASATPSSTCSWFNYCQNLTEIEGLENLNTSNVIYMESMFSNCKSLKRIDVSHFSTENVRDFQDMFSWCSSLENIDVTNFTIRKNANLYFMFHSCSNLTEIKIDIPDYIEDLRGMFNSCRRLLSVTIPQGVKSISLGDFYNCVSLRTIISEIYEPFEIDDNTFPTEVYTNATLMVPYGKDSTYLSLKGWKNFYNIINSLPKCATPIISFENGKVYFACETEGVEFVPTVTCTPHYSLNGNELVFGGTYAIKVYAAKDGYANSKATSIAIEASKMGDLNGDGEVSIADVTSLVNKILGK